MRRISCTVLTDSSMRESAALSGVMLKLDTQWPINWVKC